MKEKIKIEKLNQDEILKIKDIENSQNININSVNNITNDLQNKSYHYYVLKYNDEIIGYISFSLVIDEIELHSIVISKFYEQKGYGTMLLNFLFDFSKENNVKNIFLEVRKSNKKAISLYEKNGFSLISIREKYYPDNLEDALIYKKELVL